MASIRESLESAVATVEGENVPEAATEAPAERGLAPVPEAHWTADAAGVGGADSAAAEVRTRDETGRFAKGQAKVVAPKIGDASQGEALPPVGAKPTSAGGTAGVPVPPVAPETPELKAPQSWTPLEREGFSKAPPEVRQAILRREKEIASALQESAPARKLHQEFQAHLGPHQAFLQSRGMDPVKTSGEVMGAFVALHSAPTAQRAQIFANLLKSSGIPIEALAQAIDGAPTNNGQPQALDSDAIIQQAEARVMQRIQAQQQQQESQRWQQDVQSFASGKEFFEQLEHGQAAPVGSVRWMMSMAMQADPKLSLEDAYNHATRVHPEVGAILKQREAAEAAKATQASTQRARAASTSVRPQPAGVTAPQPKGIRAALEAAASKFGG